MERCWDCGLVCGGGETSQERRIDTLSKTHLPNASFLFQIYIHLHTYVGNADICIALVANSILFANSPNRVRQPDSS